MTKLLERAIKTVKSLSPEEQDAIALEMLALAENDDTEEKIDPAELAAVLQGVADADAGRIAPTKKSKRCFAGSRNESPIFGAGTF